MFWNIACSAGVTSPCTSLAMLRTISDPDWLRFRPSSSPIFCNKDGRVTSSWSRLLVRLGPSPSEGVVDRPADADATAIEELSVVVFPLVVKPKLVVSIAYRKPPEDYSLEVLHLLGLFRLYVVIAREM